MPIWLASKMELADTSQETQWMVKINWGCKGVTWSIFITFMWSFFVSSLLYNSTYTWKTNYIPMIQKHCHWLQWMWLSMCPCIWPSAKYLQRSTCRNSWKVRNICVMLLCCSGIEAFQSLSGILGFPMQVTGADRVGTDSNPRSPPELLWVSVSQGVQSEFEWKTVPDLIGIEN